MAGLAPNELNAEMLDTSRNARTTAKILRGLREIDLIRARPFAFIFKLVFFIEGTSAFSDALGRLTVSQFRP
jgi:hypothetical protein